MSMCFSSHIFIFSVYLLARALNKEEKKWTFYKKKRKFRAITIIGFIAIKNGAPYLIFSVIDQYYSGPAHVLKNWSRRDQFLFWNKKEAFSWIRNQYVLLLAYFHFLSVFIGERSYQSRTKNELFIKKKEFRATTIICFIAIKNSAPYLIFSVIDQYYFGPAHILKNWYSRDQFLLWDKRWAFSWIRNQYVFFLAYFYFLSVFIGEGSYPKNIVHFLAYYATIAIKSVNCYSEKDSNNWFWVQNEI